MKVLVVEDDRKIKVESVDDVLASLGHDSDWAQNQQEANGLLNGAGYDLVLLDLQIPSRPGGKDSAEFGKNLLRQIRSRPGDRVPVILMTAQHQQCVDLMTELHQLGIDGSISKPFPTAGRTLAVVISEVIERHRKFRQTAQVDKNEPLKPFAGGVMMFHPDRVELCGEVIARDGQKGHGWGILQALRESRDGRRPKLSAEELGSKLGLTQGAATSAVKVLRDRITGAMAENGFECGTEDVIPNGGRGYHLHQRIVVEEYSRNGTLLPASVAEKRSAPAVITAPSVSERQRWILKELAAGRKLTRKDVEGQFKVSERTAKRELGELVAQGLVDYDRSVNPGFYRCSQAQRADCAGS